ncbi:erythromycin esterase family protein [Legionella jordanis]|uniref:Erythromycin esterase n=1 Tax=Legionella jordanis TaxID=456 RepID=A0A0W0VAC9_9GAMM|nr:erythromycin esterase family protein [Legionella jordanis]KTD17056.1 erythromycin esterase [Legionella jordanis]RMX03191.1 erythromycin esterase family protein [Legionella jordanis]RMX18670.1 erythromycin esterase family protein [Legionella jordanis]VEH12747.1 erythromycin esterase [Legionella jordanis]
MIEQAEQKLINLLNEYIEPLELEEQTLSNLLKKIGNARFVLLGEATHGSYEFYQARIEISRQLIEKKGFMAIAIEGDWPDAYSVHRYIQGQSSQNNALDALEDFKRFPMWMWRNATIPPFLEWLRQYNDSLSPARKIGFYGLDLYSLNSSMQAVTSYLMSVDPAAAQRARTRYSCFDHSSTDPQTYGYLTNIGVKKSCIKEAVSVLLELQHNAFAYIRNDGLATEDEYFFATQNARVVKDAETYYRSMFEGRASSWNIRDRHMAETLNVLADHLENRFATPAKIIIWAHNSHVGDARATEMADQGEINIGQLVREQHNHHAYAIGFSTYSGTVTAASEWGAAAECKTINPGLEGSYEELFHELQYKNFFLNLINNPKLEHFLKIPRLQRAIGVIYRPDAERHSHYFFTHLSYQFDSIIHFDKTTALEPLDAAKT